MIFMTYDTSTIYFEIEITNIENYFKIISTPGNYKIYLFASELVETLSDAVIKVNKPSASTGADEPNTEIIKLNMLTHGVTIEGKVKKQNALIADIPTDIESKDAKLYLIDIFKSHDQLLLHSSDFYGNEESVTIESMKMRRASDIRDITDDSNPNPQYYTMSGTLVLGNLHGG